MLALLSTPVRLAPIWRSQLLLLVLLLPLLTPVIDLISMIPCGQNKKPRLIKQLRFYRFAGVRILNTEGLGTVKPLLEPRKSGSALAQGLERIFATPRRATVNRFLTCHEVTSSLIPVQSVTMNQLYGFSCEMEDKMLSVRSW